MARKKLNISEKDIEKALRLCNGVVSNAAEKLNVSHTTLYTRIKDSDFLQGVVSELNERHIDEYEMASQTLRDLGFQAYSIIKDFLKGKKVDRKLLEAAFEVVKTFEQDKRFILPRKGRHRGYGDIIEQNINGEIKGPVKVVLNIDKDLKSPDE